MKTAIALIVLLAGASIAEAQSVYVRPHVRRDGTFVEGHRRTVPDGYYQNNWSAYPNYNPYTGRFGSYGYYPQNRWQSFDQEQQLRSMQFDQQMQFNRMEANRQWEQGLQMLPQFYQPAERW